MGKEQISVTIDRDLLDWVDSKVKDKTFSGRSHALEQGIFRLRESMSDGE